ncbi:MAG: hypothetical protein R2724_28710 [Bryobacterales bacterium]
MMNRDHAEHLLHRHVGVIEERAMLVHGELVGERAAGRYRIHRNAGHAVHCDRHFQAMPVDGADLGQLVLEDDAHAIAWLTSMVGPGMEPLKPHTSTGRPGIRFCGRVRQRWNSFAPSTIFQGSLGTSGVSTRNRCALRFETSARGRRGAHPAKRWKNDLRAFGMALLWGFW